MVASFFPPARARKDSAVKEKARGGGKIHDRRGTNPPLRGALMSTLQKMIYDPPWVREEPVEGPSGTGPAGAVKRKPKIGFTNTRRGSRLSPADWQRLSRAYREKVQGMGASPAEKAKPRRG